MSASREKKRRQEQLANGTVNPRTAREAEQRAAEKRSNMLYTLLAVAFIVVAIFLVVYNSGIIERNKTAATTSSPIRASSTATPATWPRCTVCWTPSPP